MSFSFRRVVAFCVAVTALTARVAFGQGSPISQGELDAARGRQPGDGCRRPCGHQRLRRQPEQHVGHASGRSAAPPPPHEHSDQSGRGV